MTEWNASGYRQVSGLQQQIADEQLAGLDLTGQERVLDIGCGDGRVTATIAERVPAGVALGVDASHNMVALAAASAATRKNLCFAVADARRLPCRQAFDLVVSFNTLHWVPDLAAALAAVRDALCPNGRAVLRLVPDGPRRSIEDVIEEVCRLPAWRERFRDHTQPWVHPTPDALRILAEDQGLRVLRMAVEDRTWDFRTRDAFADYCRVTLAAWTRRLPEDRWGAFITDVLDRYQAIIAADTPSAPHSFRFYQLEVRLALVAAHNQPR